MYFTELAIGRKLPYRDRQTQYRLFALYKRAGGGGVDTRNFPDPPVPSVRHLAILHATLTAGD